METLRVFPAGADRDRRMKFISFALLCTIDNNYHYQRLLLIYILFAGLSMNIYPTYRKNSKHASSFYNRINKNATTDKIKYDRIEKVVTG